MSRVVKMIHEIISFNGTFKILKLWILINGTIIGEKYVLFV